MAEARLRSTIAATAPAAFGLAATLLVLLHPGVRGFVRGLDTYNPTPDLAVDIAIGLLVGLFIGYSIYLWPIEPREKNVLRRAWWVHMLVVFGPLLYMGYREDSIDGFRHYREVMVGGSVIDILTSGADTRIVNAVLWFPFHAFGGSYTASQMMFSLPAVVAALFLGRASVHFMGRSDPRPLVLFAFFPSFLIWGSFLNKEALTLLAFALYLYGVISAWATGERRPLVYAVAGIALASALRPWLLFLMVAPLAVFLLAGSRTWHRRFVVPTFAVVAVVAALSLFTILSRFESTSVAGFVGRMDEMAHYFGANTSTGREAPPFEDIGDILLFLPLGMFTLLFLPMPWHGEHILIRGGGLESLVLLAAFWGALGLVLWRRQWPALRSPIFVWLLALLVLWSAAYTFPIYQNVGLALRTRTMIVPALLLIPMVLLGNPRRDDRLAILVDDARGASPLPPARFDILSAPSRPWLSLVRLLASARPTIVHTSSGPGGLRGQLAAFLVGVPIRLHVSSGGGVGDRLARVLASHVLTDRRPVDLALLDIRRAWEASA